MHPDVKQQKTSYVSSHFRLFAGYSTRHTKHGSPARGSAASYLTSSWILLWDCYWVNDELRMHASFSCSFLRSIIRDYSRSSAAAPRRIKVCVSEIYWPNNNLCSRPTGPSSSINLNLHRNTIRAHIYLWQHSLHYSSLCGGNLIRSSSWN